MGTINFSFLPGNKSRPKTKCNLTFIPGFFSSINFILFIPYGNIFLKKKKTGSGVGLGRLPGLCREQDTGCSAEGQEKRTAR